jgi:hypothetical protein
MNLSDGEENIDRKAQVCPFLGLKDDPATALSFPSSHNRCFHARPALPVKLEFQRAYCLEINHTSCEEYNRAPDKGKIWKSRSLDSNNCSYSSRVDSMASSI